MGRLKRRTEAGLRKSMLSFVASTLDDTAAFSILFAQLWLFGKAVGDEELMAHVVTALLSSILAFLYVAIVSTFLHHSQVLTGMFTAVGLLAGFSWEKSFDVAADGLGDLPVFHDHDAAVLEAFFKVALLIIVFPAWMWYILPRSDEDLQSLEPKASLESAADPPKYDNVTPTLDAHHNVEAGIQAPPATANIAPTLAQPTVVGHSKS